jgi:hypothetical protein
VELMIVVKVELHPLGDPSLAQEIGRIEIANEGGNDKIGEYSARMTEEGAKALEVGGIPHPHRLGALALVSRVLGHWTSRKVGGK